MRRSIFLLFCSVFSSFLVAERREELLPYGNMDQWGVRYIDESKLIGGQTKLLYTVGGQDTIRENTPYVPAEDNPWACSNTYAKCIVEAAVNGSVEPEKRGSGYCCKLMNKLTHISLCDIYAIATGSIYLGENLEPLGLAAKTKPYSAIDFGVPFTKHPVALAFDYRVTIDNSTDSLLSTEKNNKPMMIEGRDSAGVVLYLQYRWEDPQTGKIYARRVGTASEMYAHTVREWVNNHEIPIRWGTILPDDQCTAYESLNTLPMMSRNSKGKMVRVEEVGYSLDEPTHIVLQFASSWGEVFQANEKNILWIDNIRLVYEDEY